MVIPPVAGRRQTGGFSIWRVEAEGEVQEKEKAVGVGFEPTVTTSATLVFKTSPFDHSGTPPRVGLGPQQLRGPVARGHCSRREARCEMDREKRG